MKANLLFCFCSLLWASTANDVCPWSSTQFLAKMETWQTMLGRKFENIATGVWFTFDQENYAINAGGTYAMPFLFQKVNGNLTFGNDIVMPPAILDTAYSKGNGMNNISFTMAANEVWLSLVCTPPETDYYGYDYFIQSRKSMAPYYPFAEIGQPLNMHTANFSDPSLGVFNQPTAIIWGADSAAMQAAAQHAPAEPNFMNLSPSIVHLVNRSEPYDEQDWDMISLVQRNNGVKNLTQEAYFKSLQFPFVVLRFNEEVNDPVPPQPEIDPYNAFPEIATYGAQFEELVAAVIENKTAEGHALMQRENLTIWEMGPELFPICFEPNNTLIQHFPLPDMKNANITCAGATRDCGYGLNNWPYYPGQFGNGDRFFVFLELFRTKLGLLNYHSLMITPANQYYEVAGHDFVLSDAEAADGAAHYMPNGGEDYLMASFARECDPAWPEFCYVLNYTWFEPQWVPLWMDRNYYAPQTGTGPNVNTTLVGVILTFSNGSSTAAPEPNASTSPPGPDPKRTTTATTDSPTAETTTTDHPTASREPTSTTTTTKTPTAKPTDPPTAEPTNPPTTEPTNPPTAKPTDPPTPDATSPPTAKPTDHPTPDATNSPTGKPTDSPTPVATNPPTAVPTNRPTSPPTNPPTPQQTNQPTLAPTYTPTAATTTTTTAMPTTSTTTSTTDGTNAPTVTPTESDTPLGVDLTFSVALELTGSATCAEALATLQPAIEKNLGTTVTSTGCPTRRALAAASLAFNAHYNTSAQASAGAATVNNSLAFTNYLNANLKTAGVSADVTGVSDVQQVIVDSPTSAPTESPASSDDAWHNYQFVGFIIFLGACFFLCFLCFLWYRCCTGERDVMRKESGGYVQLVQS